MCNKTNEKILSTLVSMHIHIHGCFVWGQVSHADIFAYTVKLVPECVLFNFLVMRQNRHQHLLSPWLQERNMWI